MRYSPFAIAVIGLALTGCAAQQQQAMVKQSTACLQAAYNSPEGALLRPHEPFNVADASLAQLADTSLASKPEIDAIAVVWPRIQSCQKQFLAQLGKLGPAFVPVFEKTYRDADDDVIALMQRKMTWGDVTKRRRDGAIAGREELQAEERKLAAEDQAALTR